MSPGHNFIISSVSFLNGEGDGVPPVPLVAPTIRRETPLQLNMITANFQHSIFSGDRAYLFPYYKLNMVERGVKSLVISVNK